MSLLGYLDIIAIITCLIIAAILTLPLKIRNYYYERSPLIKLVGFSSSSLILLLVFDFILYSHYSSLDFLNPNHSIRILHLAMKLSIASLEILLIFDLTRTEFLEITLKLQGLTEKEIRKHVRKRKRQRVLSIVFSTLWIGLIIYFGKISIIQKAINDYASVSLNLGIVTELKAGSIFIYAFFMFASFQPIRYALKLLEIRLRYTEQQQIDLSSINRAFDVIAIGLAGLIALIMVGANLQAISITTGLIAAGAAIALKELFGNFIAGLLLIWDDSIRKDNVISIQHDASSKGEVPYGWIHRITMRHTVIKDRNDIHLIIPNSILINKPIVNWSQDDNKVRIRLDLGLSYDDRDRLTTAKNAMISVALAEKRVLNDPRPTVNIMGLEDSYIHLQLRFYINDPKAGIRNVKSNIYEGIIREFNRNNLEFPYPQSDIHIKDINIS